MKRTEMITRLGNFLIEIDKDFYELGIEDNYLRAMSIIDFLEDNGMEPPKTVYQNIDKDGNRQTSSSNGDYVNHWETDEEVDWKNLYEKK